MATELEALNTVIGQVHALRAFASAVAMLSRCDGRLAIEFEKASQAALARIEQLPIAEDALDGFHDTVANLKKALGAPPEGEAGPCRD